MMPRKWGNSALTGGVRSATERGRRSSKVWSEIRLLCGFPHEDHMETPEQRQPQPAPNQAEIDDENKRIRRLQMMINMVTSVLCQEDLTIEEASELVAGAKRAAL